MNGMVGGLSGSKMSSSEPDSKIDLLDSAEQVEFKLKRAFCEEGNIVDNPILSFVKAVIFPVNSLKAGVYTFDVLRPDKFGGNVCFGNFEELQAAFASKVFYVLMKGKFFLTARAFILVTSKSLRPKHLTISWSRSASHSVTQF